MSTKLQTQIEQIKQEYKVNSWGNISSPGKFEGESIATVYYYNYINEFEGDFVEISDEEREAFNVESQFDYAVILVDGQGFVYLHYKESESHADDLVNEWYNDDEDFIDEFDSVDNESSESVESFIPNLPDDKDFDEI